MSSDMVKAASKISATRFGVFEKRPGKSHWRAVGGIRTAIPVTCFVVVASWALSVSTGNTAVVLSLIAVIMAIAILAIRYTRRRQTT